MTYGSIRHSSASVAAVATLVILVCMNKCWFTQALPHDTPGREERAVNTVSPLDLQSAIDEFEIGIQMVCYLQERTQDNLIFNLTSSTSESDIMDDIEKALSYSRELLTVKTNISFDCSSGSCTTISNLCDMYKNHSQRQHSQLRSSQNLDVCDLLPFKRSVLDLAFTRNESSFVFNTYTSWDTLNWQVQSGIDCNSSSQAGCSPMEANTVTIHKTIIEFFTSVIWCIYNMHFSSAKIAAMEACQISLPLHYMTTVVNMYCSGVCQ